MLLRIQGIFPWESLIKFGLEKFGLEWIPGKGASEAERQPMHIFRIIIFDFETNIPFSDNRILPHTNTPFTTKQKNSGLSRENRELSCATIISYYPVLCTNSTKTSFHYPGPVLNLGHPEMKTGSPQAEGVCHSLPDLIRLAVDFLINQQRKLVF